MTGEAFLQLVEAAEACADAEFAYGAARSPENEWYVCARCPVPPSRKSYADVVLHLKET